MVSQVVTNALFYLFALCAVVFAVAAVSSPRILRAAVYLMAVLVSSAALYAWIGAHMIAGIQLLVYVGGIVVLLVFAVMLTQTNDLMEQRPSLVRVGCGLLGAGLFFSTACYVLLAAPFKVAAPAALAAASPAAIGRSFLSYAAGGYALPFELISLLLLAAIIGGIVIARKGTQVNQEAR